MSGATTARLRLIHNEQTKLLANALDRAATVVGAGGVCPLINAWRADDAGHDRPDAVYYLASA